MAQSKGRIWGWTFQRRHGQYAEGHGLSSLAARAVGHTGSRGPAPKGAPAHVPLEYTHKQPASCIFKRPGLTRRKGISWVGGPRRIQLHLFTPVGHRLVAPRGREGTGRRGRGLGKRRGLLGPGRLFVGLLAAGAPSGLQLLGFLVLGWFFLLLFLISLFFLLNLLLVPTHVFPFLILPLIFFPFVLPPIVVLPLILRRPMDRGWGSGWLWRTQADRREGGALSTPHALSRGDSPSYLRGCLLRGSGLWSFRGWGRCLLRLPAVIMVAGEDRQEEEVLGAEEEGASHHRLLPREEGKKGATGLAEEDPACWGTQEKKVEQVTVKR